MFKSISVQAAQPKGKQNASLSFDDVCKMATFRLALGCQIGEANKFFQLPTPDNSSPEAKMAELARLYHLS